ncbi:MAG: ion channel [Nannocystaceae bacterium]|nr:ion channel [bacterium]
MAEERRRYRGPEDAIRIGLPQRPLQDLYYELMRGSWTWLVTLFVGIFALANLTFALLYWLDPMAVETGERLTFANAFFFSVQTISTIGYGALSPASNYADAIVTVESIVGMLGVAVGTGIIFTKFARTRANVMFSEKIVVNVRNGKPCLMLRVANARGNEVVEAGIRVAVLLNETTMEGESMRRVVDLELLRNNSPVFSLSWTVMHVIDEASPLYGFSLEALTAERAIFIVTLTGIDNTFSDSVHARRIYNDLDVEVGARFADVITHEDGQLTIDLRKFHDVEADAMWPEGLQDQTAFTAHSAPLLPESAG